MTHPCLSLLVVPMENECQGLAVTGWSCCRLFREHGNPHRASKVFSKQCDEVLFEIVELMVVITRNGGTNSGGWKTVNGGTATSGSKFCVSRSGCHHVWA